MLFEIVILSEKLMSKILKFIFSRLYFLNIYLNESWLSVINTCLFKNTEKLLSEKISSKYEIHGN